MGKVDRFESEASEQLSLMPSVFGVPPPMSSHVEKTEDKESIDEKIKDWSLDDILKLSKKSCFYANDEIEEVILVCAVQKFVILSKECESKFSPDEEQFKQLSQILSTIEPLRNKLWIAGKWNTLLDMGFMSLSENSAGPEIIPVRSIAKAVAKSSGNKQLTVFPIGFLC